MTTHSQAKAIVSRALPQLTPKESLILRAIAVLETHYGDGWKPPGNGSNNWGAITAGASWAGGQTFEYTDSRNDNGKIVKYVTKFRVYPTPEDGAIDVYKIAFKPNVKTAIALGDLLGVSRAMRDNSYYLGIAPTREGQVADHNTAMKRSIKSIIAETGEENPFNVVPPVKPPIIPGKELTRVIIGVSLITFIFLVYASNKKSYQVQKAHT